MLHIDLTPSSVANQVLLSACRLIGVLSYVNCPASHENVTWFLKTKACFCGIATAPGMGPWRLQYISANDLWIVTEVKPGLFLCRMLSQHAASFFFFLPQKNNFFGICSFSLFHFFVQFSSPCSLPFPRASIRGLAHSSAVGLSHRCQPDRCCPVSCSAQSCQIPPGSIPLAPAKTDALNFKRQSLLAAAVTTCARATTAAASTLMSCA